MSVEENLKVDDATMEALNDHDLDRLESLHLNSVIQRDPANPGGIKGPKAIRSGMEPFVKAFPDLSLVMERHFGAGDWITRLGYFQGTHTGPLKAPGGHSIPPTNKSVRVPFAFVARIEGGKLAEVNVYYDQMGMMAQLGLLPQAPPRRKP